MKKQEQLQDLGEEQLEAVAGGGNCCSAPRISSPPRSSQLPPSQPPAREELSNIVTGSGRRLPVIDAHALTQPNPFGRSGSIVNAPESLLRLPLARV